ncbi:acyl-CoA synthetase, putative [Plasmodium gallinaceum]|uniref:Acyl-CoA synthetase, putative n=1 Tax=Plasmodium gallinaceum TaxID=5849 RepID=A0A1J1GND0_PLAGA|nr:acyl-CoA synthetase, putative [Plasmodium gallinaceum]CRG93773.1 acyl-CoA synthetase, putative [Plasmodium gallinaceum]
MNEETLKNFFHLKEVNDKFIIDLNTRKKQFSYNELYIEIEKLLNFFESIGIKYGEEISIILYNSIEFVLTFLSINFNGNICLPLNTNLKKEEYKKFIVNNCKYIIIHDYDENDENYYDIKKKHSYFKNVCEYIKEISEEYHIGLIKIKKNKNNPYFTYSYISNEKKIINNKEYFKRKDLDNINYEKKDVCLHLHTSGTTSKVKIVQLTNNNIKTTIKNILNSYNINKDDNTIVIMPLYHVHGLIGVLLPILFSKGNILFQKGHSFSASEFWSNIVEYNITYFSAIPTILKILLIRYNNDYFLKESNNRNKIKHKLRFIRTSSSYLEEKVEKEIEEKFETTVLQAYGMTEACHQVSSNKFINHINNREIHKKYKSVGIPNVGVIIYDEKKKRICNYNELGEICINGKNIMYGYKEKRDNENIFIYVNTIQEKKDYMINNKFLEVSESVSFFKTGDIGYIDKENFLFICGRIKDIINRGGEKILPNEIDDVLKNNHLVRDCLTFSSKDDVYGEIINTAVILNENNIFNNENYDSLVDINNGQNIPINNYIKSKNKKNIDTAEDNLDDKYDVKESINLNLTYYKYEETLKNYMKTYLADFKIPKNIYFVNNFQKTPTGKISRKNISECVEELKKTEINIFDIIALIFKKYEIDYIYGLYGLPINKIIYSFIKNNIYFVSFRNEINAALSCNYVNFFDLDKKKKKVGILLTCSGPAFINTLSGLYNAKINNFPMILICFENFIDDKLSLFEKYYNFQYFPHLEFLKKAKEICYECFHVDSLESFTSQFYNCISTSIKNKSPVYLNIDYKLIEKKIPVERASEILKLNDNYTLTYFDYKSYISSFNEEKILFKKLVDHFCRIYHSNKKGVIFLGINCHYGIKYVLKISKLLKLPIYTNTLAKSFIKENYIYNANQCKSYLFKNIDFCFAIGSVFNFYFNFGKFENCKEENMLCIDLNNDTYEENKISISHYFFYDLYFVLKKLYFAIKNVIVVDINLREKWITNLNEAKKKSIEKLSFSIVKYLEDEKFTMEQALLIIRHILINYFFFINDISPTYKKYFINYLRHVDIKNMEDFINFVDEKNNEHKIVNNVSKDNNINSLEIDNEVPESDCDLSDSSLDDEDYGKKKKKKNYKFLNKEIKNRLIITNEGSITLLLGILYLPNFGPFNYVIPQINGMMGISMNACITSALNNPNNITFSILGDSSFGFSSNEIETICRLKLKIVLIIFNNNGIYGNREYQTEKTNIDDTDFYMQNPSSLYFHSKYENYIVSHGGYGYYVDNRKEFIKQMKHITSNDFNNFPVLLNVIIEDTGFVNFHIDKYIQ